jgi:hypothetical protein
MIGELDAGNPHVQFDEGRQETYYSVTRLCPTLPESPSERSLLPMWPAAAKLWSADGDPHWPDFW